MGAGDPLGATPGVIWFILAHDCYDPEKRWPHVCRAVWGPARGLGSCQAAGEPPYTDRHQAYGTILAQAGEPNGQGAPRGLNGARIGEAKNPGPRARDEETQAWCLTNVSGFCNAQSALSWGARLVGITELRGGVQETKATAKQAGFAVSLSEPAEDSKCLAGIFFRSGRQGGPSTVPAGLGRESCRGSD